MKKSILIMLAGVLMVPVLALGANFSTLNYSAGALDINKGLADAKPSGNVPEKLDGAKGVFRTIANAALYLIGAISVIMLIYGGIRYTTSAGDQANVTAAKNTILYAIVGIVVAILAYAIVNWVITNIK